MKDLLEEIKSGESRTLEFKKDLTENSSKWVKTAVAFANGGGRENCFWRG